MADESTFDKCMKDFVGSISAHGIQHITQTKSFLQKAIWIAICSIGLIILIVQIGRLGHKYFSDHKLTLTEVSNEAIPFPVVSICNNHNLDLYHLESALTKLYDESEGRPSYFSRAVEIFTSWEGGNETQDNIISPNSLEGILLMWHSDLNLLSRYLRNAHGVDNRMYSFLMDHSLSPEALIAMVGKKRISPFSTNRNKFIATCHFQYDDCAHSNFIDFFSNTFYNCYSFNVTSMYDTSETWLTGPRRGLSVQLFSPDIQINERINGVLQSLPMVSMPALSGDGVRVVVHPEEEYPDPVNSGFDVPSGFAASASLRVSAFRRLDPSRKSCIPDEQDNGETKYSQSICRMACMQNLIGNQCGCISPNYLLDTDQRTPMCGTLPRLSAKCYVNNGDVDERETCFKPIDVFMNQLYCLRNTTMDTESRKNMLDKCHCVPPCNQYVYDVKYSLIKWPTLLEKDTFYQRLKYNNFFDRFDEHEKRLYFKHFLNGTTQEKMEFLLEGHFIRLNVFLEDTTVLKILEQHSYDGMQVMSDIGGQMGLWMGISVITVVEALYLLISICAYITKNLKLRYQNKNAEINDQVSVDRTMA